MEYCGGGSVADLMHASDQPLDQDMIAYICADTLAGLAYLHSIGKVQSFPGLQLLQNQTHQRKQKNWVSVHATALVSL